MQSQHSIKEIILTFISGNSLPKQSKLHNNWPIDDTGCLILKDKDLFPDNWVYYTDPR